MGGSPGRVPTLRPPAHQEQVEARREQILELREELEAQESQNLHFPYYRYSATELRTLQAYMALVPRSFLELYPEIQQQVRDYEALVDADLPVPADPDPDDSLLYLADEAITVNHGGTYWVDPGALTRANQSHAQLQNQLRKRVKASGAALVPAGDAKVDLAWRSSGRRPVLHVAEVKSMRQGNEEH